MKQFIKPVFLISIVGMLAGCNDGASGPGTGVLSLGVTDAPVDEAEHVYVQFSGVEVKPKNGEVVTVDYYDNSTPPQPTTKTLDLLALRGGLRDFLLDGKVLPAGGYNWVRLKVNAKADGIYDSYIVINGSQYELNVPSGDESGLKINRPFSIPSGGSIDLTIDFDLKKSIENPNGATYLGVPVYYLRPTLRMVSTDNAGYIQGSLDSAIFSGMTCSAPDTGYAVYVYSGTGIVPDDLDGGDVDPITTTPLELGNSGYYTYRTALLEPGDYTVAATCEADKDQPESNDPITFVGTASATVTSETDPTVDFMP